MCRFLVYRAVNHRPTLVADVVVWPEHSIMKQSYEAKEQSFVSVLPTQLNADGFGVGWYNPCETNVGCSHPAHQKLPKRRPRGMFNPSSRNCLVSAEDEDTSNDTKNIQRRPCVFTSTLPAWNNRNLWNISEKVASPLIFAHVRAATPGLGVTEANCHPFSSGRFLFMHNGGVADFKRIKKQLVMLMREEVYQSLEGSTDSEHAFGIFLSQLTDDQVADRGHTTAKDLQDGLLQTIRIILHLRRSHGLPPAAGSLNFAVSDGENVAVTRFVEDPETEPATLYFSAGTEFRRLKPVQSTVGTQQVSYEYLMACRDRREEVIIIASERITSRKEDWVKIPRNTCMTISERLNIRMQPIELAPLADQ